MNVRLYLKYYVQIVNKRLKCTILHGVIIFIVKIALKINYVKLIRIIFINIEH